MKRRFPTFLSGLLAGALLVGAAISALAISDHMTIDVYPINIQVNGETFVPKDVTGAEVPVFVYNGTTYAPLRALAEAYGLTVGYDAETNLATVTDPATSVPSTSRYKFAANYDAWTAEEKSEYQAFKAMWKADPSTKGSYTNSFRVECIDRDGVLQVLDSLEEQGFIFLWSQLTKDLVIECGIPFVSYFYQDEWFGESNYTGAKVILDGVELPADPDMMTRNYVIEALSK